MKRFVYVAVVAALAFGAAGCRKAHNAGNDSMRSGAGGIVASNGQAGVVREMQPVRSSAAVERVPPSASGR